MNRRRRAYIFVAIPLFLLVLLTSYLGYLYHSVTKDAATRIQRGAIDRIIASESPVYYEDRITPIGVFFEKTHRKYIRYEQIPKVFIKALVAAEDRNFFRHRGFDIKAILRALIANIKAGKVVQGGSTLTQQTAKNIFRREKRSYRTKLKELIQAILFERKYSKEEILEMYANQFFVTGYGKGLEIASRYYFGKEAKDLDLVEAAFIAGSVKGPVRYNPFLKKTEAEKREAMLLAKLRKDYVLSNMLKLNFITKAQYLAARKRQVPFKEGRITYRLNVVLDYVREQLQSEYFSRILSDQGVENIATSGISIYTSVNKEIQEAALKSLRTHLPSMDVQLNGYRMGQKGEPHIDMLPRAPNPGAPDMPFLAEITQIKAAQGDSHLVVSWGRGGGIIDCDGLKPMAEAWLKWKLGRWVKFSKKHLPLFLKCFRVGDMVPVQLMNPGHGGEKGKFTLTRIPDLEGGIVVFHKGMVKAMAGGFFNRFFNRAVDAKRQLGSIFKPILYTAALQLKWNTLDPLLNRRNLFRFENTFYLPSPDHPPASEKVSMAWAGVKSENLATVWLLYHLTDNLNLSEFRRVADIVGLARKRGEPYLTYKQRIRDRYGVVVNREAMLEAAFEEAKKEIEPDLIFQGREEMLEALRLMRFSLKSRGRSDVEKGLLRYSYQRLRRLSRNEKRQAQAINRLLELYKELKANRTGYRLSGALLNYYRSVKNHEEPQIVYSEDPVSAGIGPLLPLSPEWLLEKGVMLGTGNVWIDGIVTVDVLDGIQGALKKIYRQMLARRRYDPEVLYRIRDFRTLVNLSYVVYLSRRIGISTKLDPVLSFPLGPNAISILEAALAYQTILTGRIYPLSPEVELTHAPIITKIVDREGEILYKYTPRPKKVLSDRVSLMISEILKKVMEMGTGKRARDAVRVSIGEGEEKAVVSIPTFGKTGTANRFTNSSFVGLIPTPNTETGRLEIGTGYVIASYVGYDDNRPMKGPHTVIYGASGALPLWIDTANAAVNREAYKKNLQLVDIAFNKDDNRFPMVAKEMVPVQISPVTGLPEGVPGRMPGGQKEHPTIIADVEIRGDMIELRRHFEPLGDSAP